MDMVEAIIFDNHWMNVKGGYWDGGGGLSFSVRSIIITEKSLTMMQFVIKCNNNTSLLIDYTQLL